jgi:multidrug resistance efflux pump
VLEKAELDLSNTQTRARSAGLITDLRTDVGQFAAAGSPVMTLITIQDIWITADMTENNLGLVRPDTPVSIVLDAVPGEVFEGHVRSVGYGISVGQPAPPGTLPGIQNSRDWLRPAQRFPVIIEFSEQSMNALLGSGNIRAGGQAEVMAFPSPGNWLNPLGRMFLGMMSWLSYAY